MGDNQNIGSASALTGAAAGSGAHYSHHKRMASPVAFSSAWGVGATVENTKRLRALKSGSESQAWHLRACSSLVMRRFM
ncbi:MAG: hypothetical protein PHV34_13485 [Verrucomicrobiae bacterium]|nr:hypothetical protein [Verrucomicrobiae bacterium]